VNGAVHSYVVAFWVSAAIFAGAAVVTAIVLPTGVLSQADESEANAAVAVAA
jgi:hypothetical protein